MAGSATAGAAPRRSHRFYWMSGWLSGWLSHGRFLGPSASAVMMEPITN